MTAKDHEQAQPGVIITAKDHEQGQQRIMNRDSQESS